MKRIWFIFVLWGTKFGLLLCKIFKKSGTMISGKVAVKLQADFIKYFKNIDYNKVIFITGTNGKSTTTNLINHVLKNSKKLVASNVEGANMMSGVATTLIKNSNLFGKFNKEYLILEIDERSLEKIYKFLPGKHLCITNIQKDQVQRNGDPDYIYQKIKKVINDDLTLYVNNEEPRAKSLEDYAGKTIYYGVEKNKASFTKDNFYDVGCPCPKCCSNIKFNYYNIDNVGSFKCSNCGYQSNDEIKYYVTNVNYEDKTFDCENITYNMPYTEPFFIYNQALTIAICSSVGITEDEIKDAFKAFKNVEGRLEILNYKTKEIKYIRIKQENPETLQSAIDYVVRDNKPKIFMIGLEPLEDFKPFYTNTFYAFDCDFKKLLDSNVEKYICFSEAVSYDEANALIYNGVEKDKICIIPSNSDEELLSELDKYDNDNVYLITWLKKYEELNKYLKK